MLMRIPNTHIQLLNGPVRHNQARALDSLWEPLAGAFKSLERNGQDVIVDAGRLGLEGRPTSCSRPPTWPCWSLARLVPALVGAASWAPTLRRHLHPIRCRHQPGRSRRRPGHAVHRR
jgi:hypothetical protein